MTRSPLGYNGHNMQTFKSMVCVSTSVTYGFPVFSGGGGSVTASSRLLYYLDFSLRSDISLISSLCSNEYMGPIYVIRDSI